MSEARSHLPEPCRSCPTTRCCSKGQVFSFPLNSEGRTSAQKIMALNNNNFKGWLDQERRIINIQLLDDCRVLTENRLCSVYGLDQRPSVCLEAEADGCFCQLIPDTV